MRYVFGLVLALAFATAARTQSDTTSACACHSCVCKTCACGLSYDAAYDKATRENKPLVVFVQCPPQAVAGCVVCSRDRFPDQLQAGVVIGFPDGWGRFDIVARRNSVTSVAQIQTLIQQAQTARLSRELVRQQPSYRGLSNFTVRGCSSGG